MKNKITILTDYGRETIQLVDFTKVDYIFIENKGREIRVLCGNKFYYFNANSSSIYSVEIF